MQGIPHQYMTPELPGIGGEIKQRLEDFIVEEVPLYEPCGQGEHAYIFLEKTDLSTFEALARFSSALRRPTREFGFAGMKDRKGITRQYFSIAGVPLETLRSLQLDKISILDVKLHRNKLRVGHLRGNRFIIRVRSVEPDRQRIERILDQLVQRGMPNYYGPQRFGVRGEAQRIGRCLMLQDDRGAVRAILGRPSKFEHNPDVVSARYLFEQYRWREAYERFPPAYRDEQKLLKYLLDSGDNYRGARRRLSREILKLYLTAYQAHLFNRVLEKRMLRSDLDLGRFYAGDIACLHKNRALFRVTDLEEVGERARQFEISPTGPIFGRKMLIPEAGLSEEIEAEILSQEDVTHVNFHCLEQWAKLSGGRRPLRVPVRELDWSLDDETLNMRFFLPKGCYATTFLRELMKNDDVRPEHPDSGDSEPRG